MFCRKCKKELSAKDREMVFDEALEAVRDYVLPKIMHNAGEQFKQALADLIRREIRSARAEEVHANPCPHAIMCKFYKQ